MPILNDPTVPADFVDPDEVARAVVTYGITTVTTGIELDFHSHGKAHDRTADRHDPRPLAAAAQHHARALQWLAGGATIQQVALDLGYESAGSFVTMFRKALGTTPGRYMAERQGTPRSPRT